MKECWKHTNSKLIKYIEKGSTAINKQKFISSLVSYTYKPHSHTCDEPHKSLSSPQKQAVDTPQIM
uniref:Uncharacterized protein LOC105114622 n=1 Tax=Rhizophora mucronata TaxID=61149 RepID=A0A2P2NBP2_RHIMU